MCVTNVVVLTKEDKAKICMVCHSFEFVSAGKAFAACFLCVLINLHEFDDGASHVGCFIGPNVVCVVKELCCIHMSHLRIIFKADLLQGIQCELDAIVNVWCFGEMSWGRRRESELLCDGVQDEVLLGTRKEKSDGDVEGRTRFVSEDGGFGFLHGFCKGSSKRLLVCFAGTEHPWLAFGTFGGCKAPCLGTRNAIDLAFEGAGMRSGCPRHSRGMVKGKGGCCTFGSVVGLVFAG